MSRNGNRKWWNRAMNRPWQGGPQPGGRTRPPRLRSRPRLEQLESRYTPSVSWSIVSGVLTAFSDNAGNVVTLDHVGTETIGNGIHFSDSAFTSIRINGGFGHDTDDILATPAKTTVVNNNGPSAVNVGKSGSTLGILGQLSIENPPNLNTITVDNSADTTAHNIGLGTIIPAGDSAFGTITNLAGAEINYEYLDTSSITIKTGHGANTVIVLGTGVPTTLVGNATSTVRVGDSGFVNGIQGALTVTNPPSFTALTVDASAETANHNVTMGVGSGVGFINGLAPQPIRYNEGDVSSVTVDGGPGAGSGGNTYTVTDTFLNFAPSPLTTLNLGSTHEATVNVLATSSPLTVTMSESELVNVGHVGSVQAIHGALTFNSTPAPNVVNFDDSADTTGRNVTINDTSVVGFAPAVINYLGHTGIDLHAGHGANTFTVNGNSGSSNSVATLDLGSGASTVNVRGTTAALDIFPAGGPLTTTIGSLAPSLGGSVANIHGNVVVGFTSAASQLIVDDSADSTARNVNIGAPLDEITGLAPAPIFYGGFPGSLTLHGGSGANTYTINDNALPSLVLQTGTGADTVNVQFTHGPVTINGQNNNTVNLGNINGTVDIQGTVTVENTGGVPAVNVNDQANAFSGVHVTLNNTGFFETVTGLGNPGSPFTLQDEVGGPLTINGGSHGNTYNVQGTGNGAVTLHTGSGNDVINVGSAANTLDGIHGPLTVDGQGGFDTLNINDQGETTPHSYTVNATSVVRSPGGPTINYFDIESLNLHPGHLIGPVPGGNTVDVQSTAAETPVEIDAGDGTTVNVGNADSTLDDIQGAVSVYGEDGSVLLNVEDQGSTSSQDYAVAADAVDRSGAATISYVGVANLTLDAGAGGNQIDVESLALGTPATVNAGSGGEQGFDLIRMRGGPVNAALTLHGQGNTHLGYVAYTTPVFVDTQTEQATDVKGGFSGISTITGGQDVNILVGDGAQDLNGVAGSRNLLISGGGSGTLTGGGVGDILIGATTAYDADANGELEAIMAEWTSSDSYDTRVFNITHGVGVPVLDATTVFDNGAQNTLIGHPQGGELNLYYVTNGDTADAVAGETVINVSGPATPAGGAPNAPAGQQAPAPAAAASPLVAPAAPTTPAAPASPAATSLARLPDQDAAWLGGVNASALNGLGLV